MRVNKEGFTHESKNELRMKDKKWELIKECPVSSDEIFDIKGKVVVITGASSGIGETLSLFFKKKGARVVCIARRYFKMLEMDSKADGEFPLDILECDISNENDVNKAFDHIIKKYNRIDVLINNAGVTEKSEDITTHSLEQWDKVINTNLFGTYICSKRAAAIMKQCRGGRIINISSICGIVGLRNQVSYVSSKGAIISMTKALSIELGEYNICVNSIAPGYILSEMTNEESSGCRYFKSRTALGRIGKPEDLIGVVLLLATDASSYITGQTFIVDGGILANV